MCRILVADVVDLVFVSSLSAGLLTSKRVCVIFPIASVLDRPGVRDVLILITDRYLYVSYELNSQMAAIKNSGIRVYVIAMGDNISDASRIAQLCSYPATDNYRYLRTIDDLFTQETVAAIRDDLTKTNTYSEL